MTERHDIFSAKDFVLKKEGGLFILHKNISKCIEMLFYTPKLCSIKDGKKIYNELLWCAPFLKEFSKYVECLLIMNCEHMHCMQFKDNNKNGSVI